MYRMVATYMYRLRHGGVDNGRPNSTSDSILSRGKAGQETVT